MIIEPGSTSQSVTILAVDDNAEPVTGLDSTTLPDIYYAIGNAAPVQIMLSDLAAVDSAYSSGGVYEIGNGRYRLDLPNAALAASGELDVYGDDTDLHVMRSPIQVGYMSASDLAPALHYETGDDAGKHEVLDASLNVSKTIEPITDITISAASWASATGYLTEVGAFADYIWRSGDVVTISDGTGVTLGQYAIASRVSDDAIELTGTLAEADVSDDSIAGTIVTGRIYIKVT